MCHTQAVKQDPSLAQGIKKPKKERKAQPEFEFEFLVYRFMCVCMSVCPGVQACYPEVYFLI